VDDHDETAIHPAEVTLLDYVVGELEHERSSEIRRHVAGCPDCRDRIVDLSLAMDELDRLPSAGHGHGRVGSATQPRRAARVIPIVLLVAAGLGVLALFQVGGLTPAPVPAPVGERVVLETAAQEPEVVVSELLGGIPHDITVDRDDSRHLIVLVQPGDVPVAADRLSGTASPEGRAYVIDVAVAGRTP